MMLDDTTRVLMEMLYYNDIRDEIESTPAMELDILAGGDPSVPAAERGAVAPQHGTNTATDTNDIGNMAQQDELSGGTAPNLDDAGDPMGDDDFGGDAPGGADDTMNQQDMSMDNPDTGYGNTNQTSEFDIENKYKLRVQIKELYDVVKSSLELCREATPPQDPEATHIFYELIKRLDEMKDVLSKLMSDLIYRKPYADSLRRFTAISKAYDLCIASMYRVFPEDEDQKKKSKTRL